MENKKMELCIYRGNQRVYANCRRVSIQTQYTGNLIVSIPFDSIHIR